MKKLFLQCSLLSFFDKKQYSSEEIFNMAMLCQKAGASVVHVHINKLGSLDEFMQMARSLEAQNGPALNLSISDYKEVISLKGEIPSSIKFAAMQGANCCVFGNTVIQSLDEAKTQMKEYLENAFIPEVIVFNWYGVKTVSYTHLIYTS